VTVTREARLRRMLEGSPYVSYLYSYPHKTAHRPLDPAPPLEALWRDERRGALFLYLHVPFCATHCGYCNLFSNKSRIRPEQVSGFLSAVERQAAVVRAALGQGAGFARFAMGGGTPTVLGLDGLARALDVIGGVMGADLHAIPACVEVSPETTDHEKLALLRGRGIDRISVGIQSFEPAELVALRRRQRPDAIHAALEAVRALGFPTLNIDLIYGIEGQTEASFDRSLSETLRHRPEEVFLYPLYVRPLTGLGLSARQWDDQRLALYRAGRARLLAAGYRQLSMRMFTLHGPREAAPEYHCQEDGMIGLACGARSYTERLHYSTPWAVSPRAVDELIEAYIARDRASFARAEHGIRLDEEDRRRRHVILSLLQAEGLALAGYRRRFAGDALDELPELRALEPAGLARVEGGRLVLTEAGLERSDLIGPWLHSDRVQALMDAYDLR